jgi:hypothetical protein
MTHLRRKKGIKGSAHSNTHLTEEDSIEIRRLYPNRPSMKEIAEQFGCSEKVVYDILHGRSWRHTLPTESEES